MTQVAEDGLPPGRHEAAESLQEAWRHLLAVGYCDDVPADVIALVGEAMDLVDRAGLLLGYPGIGCAALESAADRSSPTPAGEGVR